MNERHRINIAETIFMVYALGFTLERLAAMQEHGIKGRCSFSLLPTPLNLHSLFQGYLGKHYGIRLEVVEGVRFKHCTLEWIRSSLWSDISRHHPSLPHLISIPDSDRICYLCNIQDIWHYLPS